MAEARDAFSLEVETIVKARIEDAWDSLMDPKKSAEVFFGIAFESELRKGGPITWSGVWEGKPFVDRGLILDIEKPRLFRYSYYTSFSGLPDTEENRPIISYRFDPVGEGVRMRIGQTNILTKESRDHSEANWRSMLEKIKTKLEAGRV
jgi:uncharacterized protein YndB with AHSA1/START domain